MKFIWYFTVALGLSTFGPIQGESVLSDRVLLASGDGRSSLMHLPAIDGTAASIVAFVLAAVKVGMDPAQIMGVLHSEGYTNEELARIFEGHDEENEALNEALQPWAQDNNRRLIVNDADVAASKTSERKLLTEEEIKERLVQFQAKSEASFEADGHRSLKQACKNLLTYNIGSEVAKAYLEFQRHVDMEDVADMIDSAGFVGAKRLVGKTVQALPSSKLLSCVAEALDTTISVEYSFDATILFFNADFGINLIYGEDGQFALATTTGYGFDLGLLGIGVAAGVSISNRKLHGGWATVSSRLNDPDICFSIGYTPFLVGGAITFAITPSAVASNTEDEIANRIGKLIEGEGLGDFEIGDVLELLLDLVNYALDGKLTSVGLEATVGADVLDFVGAKLVLPDLSIHACSEELLYCDGIGCGDKLMVASWSDGTLCGLGTTCNYCEHQATYWYSKAMTACGNEPKWSDGSVCALGTTCNACKNSATYWWGKAFTACGSEPKWADGTRCLLGTSCNACRNKATWWDGPFGHHCGNEPCWGRGTVCGTGTTCNNCCRGADCPWYQFGVCTCK